MKKTHYTLLIALVAVLYVFTGCKKKPAVIPVSERIKVNYVAASVLENSTTVYTAGGASNTKPGYSVFRIDLSNPPAVRFVSLDGTISTGTYALVGETQLVLSGLTPAPTGTNGTITFTISEIGDGTVTLTRTTPDAKTGNTTNVYKLRRG